MNMEETYIQEASTDILKYCMIFFLSRLPEKYEVSTSSLHSRLKSNQFIFNSINYQTNTIFNPGFLKEF